jgi:hypothetical protein
MNTLLLSVTYPSELSDIRKNVPFTLVINNLLTAY